MSFGLRTGLGLNPDQFVIGLQGAYGSAVGPFQFAPSFDLGFGDNMTTYILNGDLRLPISLPKSNSRVYIGAGPTIAVYDTKFAGSDTEIGLSLLGGIMLPMGSVNAYNLELRLGIGDIPDVRILLGIMFGGGKR